MADAGLDFRLNRYEGKSAAHVVARTRTNGDPMRTVHDHPRRRTFPATLAIVALVVALLGFATVAANSRTAADATLAREAYPTKADRPAPTVYFPSQFELQAREPEPHIEAF